MRKLVTDILKALESEIKFSGEVCNKYKLPIQTWILWYIFNSSI